MLETYQARTKGIVFSFEDLADGATIQLSETLNEDVYILGLSGARYTNRASALGVEPLLLRLFFPDEQSMFNVRLPWEACVGTAENMMPFKAPPVWKARQELFVELVNNQGYTEEWGDLIVWVVEKDAVKASDRPLRTPWQTRTQLQGVVVDEFGPTATVQRGITFNRSGYIWAVQGAKWSQNASFLDTMRVWYGFQQNAAIVSDYAAFSSVVGTGLFPRWFKSPLPVTEHQTIQVSFQNTNTTYAIGACVVFHFVPTEAMPGMVP